MTEDVMTIVKVVETYIARHPRPTQVNIGQAAEMMGVSRYIVTRLLKTGKLKLNKCGLIPIEQVDAALVVT